MIAPPAEHPTGAPTRGRRPSVTGAMLITMGASVATLTLSLFTGVLTARLLAPSGRGQVAVVIAWAGTVQLMASLGVNEALTYRLARDPANASRIFGTSLALGAVLSLVGILVAAPLVSLLLGSQGPDFVRLTQLFLVMVLPMMLVFGLTGLFNGHHRFVGAAMNRVGQPLVFAAGLAILWITGHVTVTTVLAAQLISWLAVALISFAVLALTSPLGSPSTDIGREALGYGLRLHGQTLGALVNVRLDVMVMPMVLATNSIGIYVVAVSAASTIMPLFAQVRSVVFPSVARAPSSAAMAMVERTTRLTLLGSATTALALGVLAPVLIRIAYGEQFAGSVTPLRLLLPGLVAWAGAAIVASGLNATGRAGLGSVAQLVGLVVTVVGLTVLLKTLGINGAALTSTLSYTVVFVASLLMLNRDPRFSVRRVLSPRFFAGDVRWLVGRVRGRIAARRSPLPAIEAPAGMPPGPS